MKLRAEYITGRRIADTTNPRPKVVKDGQPRVVGMWHVRQELDA